MFKLLVNMWSIPLEKIWETKNNDIVLSHQSRREQDWKEKGKLEGNFEIERAIHRMQRDVWMMIENSASQPMGLDPFGVVYQISCVSYIYIKSHKSSKITIKR